MNSIRRTLSALNVAFWNAQEVINKKQELIDYMDEHDINVMLVNETHLKENQKMNIRNYQTYRYDRVQARGGGTAIHIKRNTEYHPLRKLSTEEIAATTIKNYILDQYSMHQDTI